MFKLHKKLLKTTHSVAELNLCTARLMDNAKFPWLILIPKRKNIRQILDLNKKDSSWPLSVWVVKGKPYKKSHLSETIKKIQKLI